MPPRAAIVVVTAGCLFGAGYAVAQPGAQPRRVAEHAAPASLALEPVVLRAGLRPGAPAALRPAPKPRRASRPRRPAPTVAPVVRPAAPVATPSPAPVQTPAPAVARRRRCVSTPAPVVRTPAPTPPPAPKPPDYVGSGFDDSG